MPKRVIIGLGGTGLEVLRHLRRRIVEDHPENGLAPFLNVGFLYLDTDEKETKISEDNRKRWEVLGRSIQLNPGEFLVLRAPAVGRILENLKAYPQLRTWLPIDQLQNLDVAARDTPGAQQIRALGRMIFTLQATEIHSKFMSVLDSLPNDPGGGDPEIVVACSLSGGTGGGMFLDLAYSLRRWLNGNGRVTGFHVLPDLALEAKRGRRYIANAYASLMDLNYFSQRNRWDGEKKVPVRFYLPAEGISDEANPFEYCYLVGTRNQAEISLDLSAIPDMIAHRVYLSLDSAIAADVAGLMNNGQMQRSSFLGDPINKNQFAQSFSTFGLSTIQYPTEKITAILAYRLVQEAIVSWTEPAPVDNVNQQIVNRMPSLLLTDDCLLGNRDLFGQSDDFKPIGSQINDMVSQRMAALPVVRRESTLNRIPGDILEEFRGGLQRYYRILTENLDGAAEVITRKIREMVNEALTDKALGYPFALEAVDQLHELLAAKRQTFETQRQTLPNKIKGSQVTLTGSVGEVTEAEGAVVFRDTKTAKALSKVKVAMAMNLTFQAENRAFEYSMTLVDRVLAKLQLLRAALVEWKASIVNLHKLLKREIDRRIEGLLDLQKNTGQFNGSVLFHTDRIEEVFREFDAKEATTYLKSKIDGGGGSLSFSGDHEIAAQRLFQFTVEWMTSKSSVRVTHKNVAHQVFEEYPGDRNEFRVQLLATNFKRSQPFLQFDGGEVEIYKNQSDYGYAQDKTTFASLAAMMDHDSNRHKEVVKLRSEITQATGLAPGEIRVISDTHQVVFISEVTAFPLRLIRDVRTLKEAYRNHTREAKALPVHIQKEFNPPMGDLLLVSQKELEQKEEAEENFLLAWSLGWIRSEYSEQEQAHEVRFRYSEHGAETFESLGDNRDQALTRLLEDNDKSSLLRSKLEDRIQKHFQKVNSRAQRTEIAAQVIAAVATIKTQLEFGEENATYKRYNLILQNLVKRFSLAREGEALPERVLNGATTGSVLPVKTAAPMAGGESQNEKTFTEYASVIVARVKGKLSDRAKEMMQNRQTELGLTASQASAILQRELDKFTVPAEAENLAAYRKLVRDTMELTGGTLDEDAELDLANFEARNGISAEDAARIRAELSAA